ncbi:hypothetical protein VP01_5249g1, partial [Puccinia sorghi]
DEAYVNESLGTDGTIALRIFFGNSAVDVIVKNINKICASDSLARMIGGEIV